MKIDFKSDIDSNEAIRLDMMVHKAIKEFRLQSLGLDAVKVIVSRLNIEPFYEYFVEFNESNNLPYHNFYHSICVFLNCYEGAWHMNLDDESIRGLCVGALFHDFDHSGGNETDEINIEHALKGLHNGQVYAEYMLLELTNKSLNVAIKSIKSTQYPFVKYPDTIEEQIIRDADLMQAYEESAEVLLKQYIGLKQEVEIVKGPMSKEFYAEGMKQWLDVNVEWYTKWANDKASVRNWELMKHNLHSMLI